MWGMKKNNKSDRVFLFYVIFLLIVGLVILNSSSAAFAYSKFNDTYYFVKAQLLRGILPGLVLFLIFAKVNYENWFKYSRVFYFLTIILLVLVFIPGIGTDLGKGAHSWINFSFISFQPAELAKLTLIVILAKMLSEPDRDLKDWQNGLLPILVSISPIVLLVILQPDIGTLSILCIIAFFMLIMAGVEGKIIALLGLVGVVAFGILILIAPYRMNRMSIFLHPELDPQGIGYHVNQAYLAVGSGGLWGLGYGHSRQKHLYLPEVQADSIFAVFAEEMGFFLTMAFILVFLAFSLRGLKIAREASSDFGRLLVGGIMIWFFMQSCLNMAAMVGGSPLTGVPLPLISHGGSAMMVMLMAMGIVLNVSKNR